MKRLNFPLIVLAVIFFAGYSCKKKESDPKPETSKMEERTFTNSVDTMVVCSPFDGFLVGNEYVQFLSVEAQKKLYESGSMLLGGGYDSFTIQNGTLVSRRYDDMMYGLEYKIVGNQLIIKGYFGDEVYDFDHSCEEKVYDSDGRCWYKSNK
jgi:hypothetical protein